MTKITYLKAILFLTVVLLGGCSNGGGGGSNNTNPSSNWDEMVWDQDNWA